MSNTCFFCGNQYTPQQLKDRSPNKTVVKHTHEGQVYTDTVIPFNDAFYEIVSGPRKGGLVHRWNLEETAKQRFFI